MIEDIILLILKKLCMRDKIFFLNTHQSFSIHSDKISFDECIFYNQIKNSKYFNAFTFIKLNIRYSITSFPKNIKKIYFFDSGEYNLYNNPTTEIIINNINNIPNTVTQLEFCTHCNNQIMRAIPNFITNLILHSTIYGVFKNFRAPNTIIHLTLKWVFCPTLVEYMQNTIPTSVRYLVFSDDISLENTYESALMLINNNNNIDSIKKILENTKCSLIFNKREYNNTSTIKSCIPKSVFNLKFINTPENSFILSYISELDPKFIYFKYYTH